MSCSREEVKNVDDFIVVSLSVSRRGDSKENFRHMGIGKLHLYTAREGRKRTGTFSIGKRRVCWKMSTCTSPLITSTSSQCATQREGSEPGQ
mmetsp:Transcript_25010/g.36616  ORF Transcript_25010/g.36616 Transcript_25010/m.36616 type:complete len:92 (+) Transcript_25010:272-547(+)